MGPDGLYHCLPEYKGGNSIPITDGGQNHPDCVKGVQVYQEHLEYAVWEQVDEDDWP